ncbi:F-box protein AUF2-like [Coffea arabica]|uniref:F-box protein AUF2-like n=1 Tax=Coffea arabica TaxID=13443 RepID=A0ABM4W3A4_COFAR
MEDSMTIHTILSVGEDGEHHEDPFQRLPDDLIIFHIFGKICEAKELLKYSLVSKHFSSLVYKTETISFKVPRRHMHKLLSDPNLMTQHPLSLPQKILKSATSPLVFVVRGVVSCCMNMNTSRRRSTSMDLELLVDFIAKNLGKFKSMRSLDLEIDYPGYDNFRNDALVKWKFDSKSSSFILLVANRLLELDANNAHLDDDFDYEDVVSGDLVMYIGTSFHRHMAVIVSFWTSMMEKLAPFFTESLQNVAVTDSKKQGRAEIGGSDLARMRKSKKYVARDRGLKVSFWYAPVIKLPSPGSAVKMVTLVICKPNGSSNQDDHLVVEEAFRGEDKIYAGAAMEMLKKKPNHEGLLCQ